MCFWSNDFLCLNKKIDCIVERYIEKSLIDKKGLFSFQSGNIDRYVHIITNLFKRYGEVWAQSLAPNMAKITMNIFYFIITSMAHNTKNVATQLALQYKCH